MVYIDEQIKKYKRNGSELIDGEKFVYAHERIIIPVIMHFDALNDIGNHVSILKNKIFLLEDIFQIDEKKFFLLAKL